MRKLIFVTIVTLLLASTVLADSSVEYWWSLGKSVVVDDLDNIAKYTWSLGLPAIADLYAIGIPAVGTVILNGGSDITLVENTTKTVSATATVTDTGGYSDISSVIGKIYRSGQESSCSTDDNNCYEDSACATSSCSGNSCTATCEYDVWFHADPTDSGSVWESEYWEAWIKAIDVDNASSSATSNGQEEVNTLRALDVTIDDWFGISSAEFDSECGSFSEDFNVPAALDGISYWWHAASEIHWFILDLGETYTIKKVRGRSYTPAADPIDVNIYVSDSKESWGDAVATGITTWQDVGPPLYDFVEIDTEDKDGRYIKVEIEATEEGTPGTVGFGNSGVTKNTIFDAYGDVGIINYGALDSGGDTGALSSTTTVTDTGNTPIDIYLYGTDMEKGSDSIGIEYQEWSTSSFTYGAGTNATSVTNTAVELDLSKPTSHSSTSSDDLYWGAEVPSATPKGNYYGTISFEAKKTWLDGYDYRAKIPVNYSTSGAQTNYQKKITVHYGSGSNSAGNIYSDNHSKTDFSDIRFTQADGETEIDYWMEESTTSDQAVFWVELPSTPAAGFSNYYVYYGNADATTISNGNNTFLYFDHWTSDNTGDWSSGVPGPANHHHYWEETVTSTNSYRALESNSTLESWNDGTWDWLVIGWTENKINDWRDVDHVIFRWSMRNSDGADDGTIRVQIDTRSGVNASTTPYTSVSTSSISFSIDALSLKLQYSSDVVSYEWKNLTTNTVLASSSITDSSYIPSPSDLPYFFNEQFDAGGGIWSWSSPTHLDFGNQPGNGGMELYVDYWLYRNYTSPEPAWATPGSEESE